MKRKSVVLFLLAVALIISSEYFFLHEIYEEAQFGILLFTALGTVLGILILVQIIRKYKA